MTGISNNKSVIRLSGEEIQILDFVKQMGKITSRDIADIIKGSERTIQRRIKALMGSNYWQKKAGEKTAIISLNRKKNNSIIDFDTHPRTRKIVVSITKE